MIVCFVDIGELLTITYLLFIVLSVLTFYLYMLIFILPFQL